MKRLTLLDLDPPQVVVANTYGWRPGWNAAARRYNEKKNLHAVEEWLRGLDEKYGLGLRIVRAGCNVLAFRDSQLVARFYYYESCSCVYKKQDFRSLLKLIRQKL